MTKGINGEIIHALAQICTNKCKEYLTAEGECSEQCPEMKHLYDMLWKYPIKELDIEDYDCPQEHLNRNSCIIRTDDGDICCPHWDLCEFKSDVQWIYVPLK